MEQSKALKNPKHWEKLNHGDQVVIFEQLQKELRVAQFCNKSREFTLKIAMKHIVNEIHKKQETFLERVE